VASVIFNLLTIAILTIYFLMGLPQSQRAIEATFRGEHRARNVMVFEESIHRIGGYVSGNIATSIIAGVPRISPSHLQRPLRRRPRDVGGDRRPDPDRGGDPRRACGGGGCVPGRIDPTGSPSSSTSSSTSRWRTTSSCRA